MWLSLLYHSKKHPASFLCNKRNTIFHCSVIADLIGGTAFIQDELVIENIVTAELSNCFSNLCACFLNDQHCILPAGQCSHSQVGIIFLHRKGKLDTTIVSNQNIPIQHRDADMQQLPRILAKLNEPFAQYLKSLPDFLSWLVAWLWKIQSLWTTRMGLNWQISTWRLICLFMVRIVNQKEKFCQAMENAYEQVEDKMAKKTTPGDSCFLELTRGRGASLLPKGNRSARGVE